MKTMPFPHPHQNGLLVKSFAFSLLLHAGALTFFYFNPVILQGPFNSLFGMSSAAPTLLEADEDAMDSLQKNHLIEEVFQQIIVMSPHLQQPYDLAELPKGIALAPNLETAAFEVSSQVEKIETPHQEMALSAPSHIKMLEESSIPALFVPDLTGAPIASQLQIDTSSIIPELPISLAPVTGPGNYEDLITISEFALNAGFEADYALNLSPQLVSPDSLKIGQDLQLKTEVKPLSAEMTKRDLKLDNELVRSTLFIPKVPASIAEKKEVIVTSSMSELDQYDFPPMATAAEWNDDFDAEVTFLPNPEGKGYIFSVALNPNFDISTHSLKQNIYFILDRSDSVQKHRFAVFKRAVLKALTSMQRGDTFNIFVIDKKIVSFSKQNTAVAMKTIQAAEEFLDKQEGGTLFSAGEIYTSLDKILTSVPDNDEIHTAILLTDGKSNLSVDRRQSMVKKWVEKNNGRMSLYTAAIGRDNDLLALDLLSSVSGGKLLYSDTHASFPRKLAKLIIDLKDPVAKDLIISAVPHNPHSHIEFYPANSHLPSLYSHQPYVLVGQIDDPCAFDLIIQGRHRDQWIAIKKNISFVEGHKGDPELTMKWTAQRANLCYAKFLKEGKVSHLKEAKEILKKSRSEVAFE